MSMVMVKRTIKVIVKKASNLDYREVLEFGSWEEVINYMRETYSDWIVFFNPSLHPDIDAELIMYDDYWE